MTPLSPQPNTARSVPRMNTSQLSAPSHSHPLSGAGCWLLAPRAETQRTARARGDYSDTRRAPPKVAGIAGSGGILPRLIRRIKPHFCGVLNALQSVRGESTADTAHHMNADSGVAQRVERRICRRSQGQSLPSDSAFSYSQRVTSMCHSVSSATGAASLRMLPTSLPVNFPQPLGWGLFGGVA